ncbi:hypothetical protein [Parapedobacter defluvii]|uniref:hypothetical protein n=1 Tax=Parapedobacter defluvii TaxID=2045106 RepID=UPI00333ECD21
MKHKITIQAIYIALILFSLAACKKEQPNEPDQQHGASVVYERGNAVGPIVKKNIGADGGTIGSADGRIKLDIPAGALSSSTEISIQEVSNTLPGSPCPAFRLLPENVTFKSPVNLTFQYQDGDLDSTSADALFMAFQEKDGVWKFIPETRLDKKNRLLTVQTTHFSDWAPYALFWLRPEKIAIKVAEEMGVFILSNNDFNETMGYKPNHEYIEVRQQRVLTNHRNHIKNWTATKGQVEGLGDVAVYIAPKQKPQNPLAVISVEVHDFIPPSLYDVRGGASTKLLLMSEVIITDDTYWQVSHQGNIIGGIEGKCSFVSGEWGDGNFWIAGWHSETQGFSGIIYGLGAPKVGVYPWHNGDSYEPDHHKSRLQYIDLNRELYAPITWWTYCDDNSRDYRASPGGIYITKVETLDDVEYVEGYIQASLWNHSIACNQPKDSDVRIAFRLTHKIMSDEDN